MGNSVAYVGADVSSAGGLATSATGEEVPDVAGGLDMTATGEEVADVPNVFRRGIPVGKNVQRPASCTSAVGGAELRAWEWAPSGGEE